MAIKPECDKCGGELQRPGGLAFSPPNGNSVVKYHVCEKCWLGFLRWLQAKLETT